MSKSKKCQCFVCRNKPLWESIEKKVTAEEWQFCCDLLAMYENAEAELATGTKSIDLRVERGNHE